MPLQATSGAASYDAFGGGVAVVPNFIEDVFSTYLYTGNDATQTINNGIDLSTKGGLVWIKSRSSGSEYHVLQDTVRGRGHVLSSNTTDQSFSSSAGESITTYNSNGFSLGINRSATQAVNTNAATYASWTFREQPKFFDVVTYTGDGLGKTIPHNLGSTPGCILIKRTDAAAEWRVFHRSLNDQYLVLNSTAARVDMSGATLITCTSTTFYVGENAALCANGGTYVAYLFAHNAGGFGLTGTDNVISCGSFTTTSGGVATVNLGYEPQWILFKSSASSDNWSMFDNMRGWPAPGTTDGRRQLKANTAESEGGNNFVSTTSTGFETQNLLSPDTFIYIAIRRGPMKVPTDATKVFAPAAVTPTSGSAFTVGFPFDATLFGQRNGSDSGNWTFEDRLRGFAGNSSSSVQQIKTSSTAAEFTQASGSLAYYSPNNTGATYGPYYSGASTVFEFFRRAPGFFDEVCYTGTGAATTVAHNLGVAPELMIIKNRSASSHWIVYAAALGNTKALEFTASGPTTSVAFFDNTSPTSSVFTVGYAGSVNGSGSNLVSYLFASVPGVSKVGNYTGTGAAQTINCGFAGGARFVLIKRTDSTGDWYVWDTVRGIVAGNDPYLLLNSTAAEVTSTDYIDTYSAGFEVTSTAPAALNATGGTYIFLAVS